MAAFRHVIVAVLMAIGFILCRLDDVSWALLGLCLSVGGLAAAPGLGWSRKSEELACALALLFFMMHVVSSITAATPISFIFNKVFASRIATCALLSTAAWIASRRTLALAGMMSIVALVWMLLSLLAEMMRVYAIALPQLAYAVLLLSAFVFAWITSRFLLTSFRALALLAAFFGVGAWAAKDASDATVFVFLVLTPVVLLNLAWRHGKAVQLGGTAATPAIFLGVLPLLIWPWSDAGASVLQVSAKFFSLSMVASCMLAVALLAQCALPGAQPGISTICKLHFRIAAVTLVGVSLFHIERGIWPVSFDLIVLSLLIISTIYCGQTDASYKARRGAVTMICAALVAQAMLLRAFGPDQQVMQASDIDRMNLPAVVSLMWAIIGAGLTWWAVQAKSRTIWSAGAILLVLSAVKLVLFDFGSLGELGNILALISVGLIFMGVAWFAPFPPRDEKTADEQPGTGRSNPYAAASIKN